MNRRERRQTSKRLGIQQYQQKLPMKRRLELMYENIITGKQMQMDNTEKVRQSINEQLEEKESQVVYHLAEAIAKRKQIPVLDAMKEAQKQININRKA